MEGMEATGVMEERERMELEIPILMAATVVSGKFFFLNPFFN